MSINKCDFTIIADADGLGAQLFDIKNEAVSKSGDSEVRINNTQFFKTINLFDLSEGVIYRHLALHGFRDPYKSTFEVEIKTFFILISIFFMSEIIF